MFPKLVRVQFSGALGQPVAARLDLPADAPRAYALFAHCFTCTKDLKPLAWISRELTSRRIALLRFDFTGLGESGGDFADTNFSTNVQDLLLAVDSLRANYRAPEILIGHSLGGTAVLAAAAQVPETVAVATIAAPSGTAHLSEFLRRQAGPLAPEQVAHVNVVGRPVRIKGQMIDDLGRHNVLTAVAALNKPLLLFHSPRDELVPIEQARQIFDAAQHPKSFISLDDADHLLLRDEQDARYVAEVLAAWASRYLRRAGSA